jgi:outer membrane receptor protein involved in Fe transport
MMKNRKTVIRAVPVRVTPIAAAVATALGSFSGISIADDQVVTTKEEIVVTATRRDTTVQEVPYSISVLDAKTLDELKITDLSGIARWTPGLTQVDQGARDGSRLIIRGMNVSNINSPEFLLNTSGERVATYYGETPVYIDLKLIDIERVETLLGPQGTLYGAKSIGGAIRYIPNQPDTNEFSVDAHARGYGMDESHGLSSDSDLVINAPLIQDTLALRAMVGYAKDQGYIDYNYLVPNPGTSCPEPGYADPECDSDGFVKKRDVNDLETKSASLSLLWDINDTFDATLSWRYQDQESGGRDINSQAALLLIEANRGIDIDTGDYVSGMRYEEPNDRENNIYNLKLNWDTGFADLVSSTSYSTYDQDGQRDQTDFLLDLEPDFYYYYDEFPAFTGFALDTTDEDTFTQEVRLVSKEDDSKWNWIAGLYFTDVDFDTHNQEFTPGYAAWDPFFTEEFGDLEYDAKSYQDSQEFAAFGELGYEITDQWQVSGGARWFTLDQSLRNCTAFPMATTGFGGNPDVNAPENCDYVQIPGGDEDDTLWKFSTAYDFDNARADSLRTYFTFAQGYNNGTLNTRTETTGEIYVKPEEADNYELGLKSQWLDGSLTVNAAVYYIDWKNTQVDGKTETGAFNVIRNGGPAETKGLELSVLAYLTDNWYVNADYAYVNAELDRGCTVAEASDGSNDCAIPDQETASGDRLPGSPEHQGSVRVGYETVLSGGLGFNAIYGLTTQSDVFSKLGDGDDCCRDNGESLAGFTVHFVSAGLSADSWEASLYVDNLFDKYAVTGVREDQSKLVTAGPPPDFTLRRYFNNVIRPRTYGIDLRYKFK